MKDYNVNASIAQEGDLAELVGLGHKHFIIKLAVGGELHTHRGILKHNLLIGKPWGSKVQSHLGNPFFLLPPSIADLLKEIPRTTQIMYPKDIGFILISLGIGPGKRILEAGTGSGAFTTAAAFAVGDTGKIYSYEVKEQVQALAVRNLKRLGLEDRVSFKIRDIKEGFDEENIDALFLDVPNPYDYIPQVKHSLKTGGYFCSILPTTNQVSRLISALRIENFAFIDVVEILLRYYKPEPDRLRPTDRMVAHTGFLIFARPIIDSELFLTENSETGMETGYVAEKPL